MDDESRRPRRGGNALSRFMAYLEELERAVLARDGMRITSLLRRRTATHLPREVREELLAQSRAPRGNLRAPVQFLRFQHCMYQLALGGEPLPTAQTELRLDPSEPAGTVRREALPAARRQTASDPTDDLGEDASP